jgi:ABC-type glutathione transport system ATPase component
MKKILYLLRGVPGSGKSTVAQNIGGTHFETDKYFMVDGEYKFDPTKLKQYHQMCQDEVNLAMIQNHTAHLNDVIVVSNTFTQEWEMKPYFDLVKTYGYQVFSLIVENRHGGLNQHGVPEDKVQIMKDRFEIKL